MQTTSMLAAAKIFLSLTILTYASWRDHKTREVSNKVWLFYAPPALTLTLTELFLNNFSNILFYGLSFGLTATFAVILFYAGGFGGADAKALMCLALALPFYPQELLTPLSSEVSPTMKMFFPITVFSNSVLLAALTAIYLLIHNILWHQKTKTPLFSGEQKKESLIKKILVLITGYKTSVKKLKDKWHLYPMEDLEIKENKLIRKLVAIPKDEGRDAIVERLAKAVESGEIQETVWATPGLPLLIFITAGLILALVFGDIVWIIVCSILG